MDSFRILCRPTDWSELWWWGLGLLGLGVLTSCSRPPAPGPVPAPEVATITVDRQSVRLTTELPGRTAPYRIAEIRPQVNGLVLKRLFTEGSDVEAGQPLYQIDPAPFQATLDSAEAALARAQANLPSIQARMDRLKTLSGKAVSQQDLDDAAAALRQAEADVQYYQAMVATARINLGYTEVVSPIAGRIGASTVTDGAIVTAYQPLALATIQQLDPIYVDVAQSTTELLQLQRRLEAGRLQRGGTNSGDVRLVLPDDTSYPLPGAFQFRDVSVDPSTASVILRMVFPNPDGVLLPGMFVRAVIEEGANQDAILIPQQSVTRDPKGNPLALVLDPKGLVEQRKLTLDRALGDQWLVAQGLEPGDRIIVEGLQKARPGTPVQAVPFKATPPETGSVDATASGTSSN